MGCETAHLLLLPNTQCGNIEKFSATQILREIIGRRYYIELKGTFRATKPVKIVIVENETMKLPNWFHVKSEWQENIENSTLCT